MSRRVATRRRHKKADPTRFDCVTARGSYRSHDLRRSRASVGRPCARCSYVWQKSW